MSLHGLRRLKRLLGILGVLAGVVGVLFLSQEGRAQTDPQPLADGLREEIIDSLAAGMERIYVFPEVGARTMARIRERLGAGAYESARTLPEFTQMLTKDLQEIAGDVHLMVYPQEAPDYSETSSPEEAERAFQEELARRRMNNFWFTDVRRLPGNVGYMKMLAFADARWAGATATAAMNFLGNSDALIIDLRDNTGGQPNMSQLISSYLFEEPTLLNSFFIREDSTTVQFWTEAVVEGPRITKTPVYILTNSRTVSAAEGFAYSLKHRDRATIVGEITAGGANPSRSVFWEDLGVAARISYGRAINPITGTNWDGVGVQPDIDVPGEEALSWAHATAIRELLEVSPPDHPLKEEWDWTLVGIEGRLAKCTLTADEMTEYVGTYGPRVITLQDSQLTYQRSDIGGASRVMVPFGEDLFGFAEAGDFDDFRIRFQRDDQGRVVKLIGLYAGGYQDSNDRNSR